MTLKLELLVRVPDETEERSYSYSLRSGESLRIGRGQEADLVVIDRNISRNHCVLVARERRVVLDDCSKNGTFLRATRIQQSSEVQSGDTIEIGRTRIQVWYEEGASFSSNRELVGANFGEYRVDEVIGSGSLGVVYKGFQERFQRVVAIKTLSQRHLSNPALIDRFLRIPKVAGRLTHPNIVQIYDAGALESHRIYYLVMEYIEGQNLSKVLRDRNTLPIEEAVEIFRQIGSALVFAGRKRIVHRDVNPSNILLGSNGLAKLAGLGLAKSLEGDVVNLTQSGASMGMVHFVSPEQIMDARQADEQSDLYSLGAVFYRTITGRAPHESSSRREFFQRVQEKARVEPACGIDGAIPRRISEILDRCLEYDPADRYPGVEDFLEDLRKATARRTLSARSVEKMKSHVEAMMPDSPQIEGYEFAAHYQASEEVGGDFYDFVPFDDGKLGILQGDVSGHGISAAIVMGMAKTYLKLGARRLYVPSAMLSWANEELVRELDGSTFLTAVYARLDPEAYSLQFARAGHNPLLLVNPDRDPPTSFLEPAGTILGMLDSRFFSVEVAEIALQAGDKVLLFTDGVVEARGEEDQGEFGFDQFAEAALRYSRGPVSEMVGGIVDRFEAFCGNSVQEDDITIVAIGVLGDQGK